MAEPRPSARTFHVDLCEAADGWSLVLGWVVRAASEEPEAYLRRGTRLFAPVATFARPDVIDYLLHTAAAGVRAEDVAYSFILAAPEPVDAVRLHLQGTNARLVPAAPRDAAVLDRYRDALRDRSPSPATEAARRRLGAMGPPLAGTAAAPASAPPDVQSLLRQCQTGGDLFVRPRSAAAPGRAATLALFAIHQAGRHLTHAQRAMLEALRARGCEVVLVNSSPAAEVGAVALREGLAAGCVTRTDHGRDFASWLLALTLLGERAMAAPRVLFCNDSFLGPFDDLAGLFAHHAEAAADIWGLTDSWEQAWHVQSSFFVLSARALASDALAAFRAGYAYPDQRDAVVRQGEVGLSRALVADRSLSVSIVAPYAALARAALDAMPDSPADEFSRALLADLRAGMPRNPQHVFWRALLQRHRIPFVKRDLLANNPAGVSDYAGILPAVAETFGAAHATRAEADLRAVATRAPVR